MKRTTRIGWALCGVLLALLVVVLATGFRTDAWWVFILLGLVGGASLIVAANILGWFR